MLRIALSQIQQQFRRFVACSLAILLAVAFLVATLCVNTTLQATIRGGIAQNYAQANAVASPSSAPDSISRGSSRKAFAPGALEEIKRIPQVASSYGMLQEFSTVKTESGGFDSSLKNIGSDAPFDSLPLLKGDRPQASDEVAVDSKAAERYGLSIGSPLRIGSPMSGVNGPNPEESGSPASPDGTAGAPQEVSARIVGILDAEKIAESSRFPQVVAPTQLFEQFSPPEYYTVQLVLNTGTSESELSKVKQQLSGLGYPESVVRSVKEQIDIDLKTVYGNQDFLTPILVAFAVIALIVAVLVVGNTFSVLVAQRTRELALLRCLGANKKQVRRSVVLEALVIGILASVLGAALGIAGMFGLVKYLQTTNPLATFDMSWTAPVAGVVVGVLLALSASLFPARAATSVSPLAAMSAQANTEGSGKQGKTRVILGLLMLLVGGGVLGFSSNAGALGLAVAGGALSFLGIILCAPAFIPRLTYLLGAASSRTVPGQLARLNAIRNPSRTTATASALLIGVTLVSLMLTGAATSQNALDQGLKDRYPVDMMTTSNQYTPQQIQELSTISGVDTVISLPQIGRLTHQSAAETSDTPENISSSEVGGGFAEGTPVYSISAQDAERMFENPQNRPSAGKVLMPKGTEVDTTTVLAGPEMKRYNLPTTIGTAELPIALTSTGTIPTPDSAPQSVWVKLSPSVTNNNVLDIKAKISSTLKIPEAQIGGGAVKRADFESVISIMLSIVIGMLGIAVLIALIGVANTLSLSVLERTRENSLLRALGLDKSGLRKMLALEAVLISGVATVIGVVLGCFYGWLGAKTALSGFLSSVPVTIPWLPLLMVMLVAVLAGLLASLAPARRATRLSPVEGLATE